MIVIPMAGMSRRFTQAGYDCPKFMLQVHGKPVFDRAVESFANYFGSESFLFVLREAHGAPEFIRERCAKLGVKRALIHVLNAPTQGQAETVAAGVRGEEVALTEPLTIFNIDTFRPGFRFPQEIDLEEIDGYLEVFPGEGEHWSFVRPELSSERKNSVAEVAEKVRISNLCSTGLYYFRSAGLFLDVYGEVEFLPAEQLQGGERYVAPLYNRLLERGGDIRYHQIDPGEVIFCGTPAEYEQVLNRGRAGNGA
jgi:NDP-sugar pyrophosphorylase family protein